ncbi:hypothetical protein [Nitratidesulfovibrio liaohensis]|uniref:Uncharacterized protein n=1 Tax=Nitratidesulfovibrio liaohensis TaxID=2604158 RepID=A0ABY9R7P8_9BACT|nr:hypothetical protein [Nitratidesulfovibrio liaohensis]WMW66719.1 hypothetical protein KPS_001331 [Nitratidesulfovibrio liaohensis]
MSARHQHAVADSPAVPPSAFPTSPVLRPTVSALRTGFARRGANGRTRLHVFPARRQHLRQVLPHLRPRDRAELDALGPRGAVAEAARAFALSPLCWAVLRGGRCVALFGARPFPGMPDTAAPWLFGTPDLDAEGRALARLGPLFAERMRAAWPRLVNMIHAPALAQRPATVHWLARCGFAVAAHPMPLGHGGAPFHPFTSGDFPAASVAPEQPTSTGG